MPVNEWLAAPKAPGDWVDEESCACGATYHAFRAGVRYTEGAATVRRMNGQDRDTPNGWRSRGPVLWAMRVMKLQAWYLEHATCAPRPAEPGQSTGSR
jgi:hypothetical protein